MEQSDQTLMTRLSQHRALGSAPITEHAWLVAHGTMHTLPVGHVLMPSGGAAHSLYIVFSGHLTIRVDRGAGSHPIIEWGAGDVSGLLPFSRGTKAPNDVVVEETTEHLEVEEKHFPELIRECPSVTAALVHAMLDRARQFTSSDLRVEKLVSLGKLAAGLAHELNNPASAVMRSAKVLAESLTQSETAARRLGALRLTDSQLASIDAVHATCRTSDTPALLSSVARADRPRNGVQTESKSLESAHARHHERWH